MSQAHYLTNGYHEFKPRGAVPFDRKGIAAAIERTGYVHMAYKVDGVRVILQVHPDGRVTCTSRTSKVLPALRLLGADPDLRERLREKYPRGVVLDCEISVVGRSFQEGCGDLRRKVPIDPTSLVVWPILQYAYDEVVTGVYAPVTLGVRMAYALTLAEELSPLLGFLVHDLRIGNITSVDDIEPQFEVARALSYEGLIAYDPANDVFDGGKRVGWWKVKPESDIDGKVVNWIEGTGKYVGMMGALTVECEDGTITDVGTGFTDDQRKLGREYWLGRLVQLTFMERTDDGNLRHPAFDRMRDLDSAPGLKS
ncbi:DNA ligase-like protein [Ralstonia phage RpY2]|uniref:DNA ligase-like protein n=1 Tax=Ralstonia phage RpY2 TaxID=2880950 RepID=A0AC61TNX0_9CAUD|nr:DNA ligase-like protein [Ralstonia phage RpY2]WAX26362.1 ATP-dependent DNA ligase [Ralstonia phage p2137]